MLISLYYVLKRKGKLVPSNLKVYVIRNLMQCMVINGLFLSIKLTPISVFNTVFNTRCLMCFLIETYVNRKRPRPAYVLLSILSFVGIMMLIYPSLSHDLR